MDLRSRQHPSHRPRATFAGSSFLVLATVLAGAGVVPWIVPLVYLVMSVVAFVAYALDKAAAKAGKRRTSEATLLTLGLLCGWPGALIAQELLRHKTRKRPFRALFFVTVVANLAGVAWLVMAPSLSPMQ